MRKIKKRGFYDLGKIKKALKTNLMSIRACEVPYNSMCIPLTNDVLDFVEVAVDVMKQICDLYGENDKMSDTIFSVLIEEFKKNGVKVKEHYFEYDNLGKNKTDLMCESSDTQILDFTEHDKVFEDRIAKKSELIDKLYKENVRLEEKCMKKDADIFNLQCENRELEKRISELESKETVDLPFDPLDTANYLINATYERETNGIERAVQNLPEKVSSDRYTVDELEQIAEHLLIYCRHNKE